VAVAYGRVGGYFIDDYAGLGYRAPGLAIVMTVFLFSLAGIPPLAGWAAKLFIFRAVIDGHEYWLAAAMAVNTVIALFYYAKVVRRMFFEPAGDGPLGVKVPLLLQATLAVSTVMVLLVGILPDLAGRLAKMSTLV
jgi:NADH-quinone oxidoreductase subunit N